MKVLLIFVAIICLGVSGQVSAQPVVGNQAPDIVLPDVQGRMQKLSGETGKVVLIDFWASWCAPCRKANPELVRLHGKYKQKGFSIFSVSLDENVASWKKAIAKDKMKWTQVVEKSGWYGPVATAWKIEQIPASFLIDNAGKIIAVDLQGAELEQMIRKLIGL